MRTVRKSCPHSGLDFFAGLASVHLIQDVQERSEFAFAVESVHIIVDSNIADTFTRKVDLRVLTCQNIVST